ncbi:protein-disulfide reductase DsbD domain-containing protein [Methylocella sp.]|uniref:protein-disulfide reductase DsbD domain-containing protein n=1 Tax=Methylocella sp. TaxID=1978226 RepID=UPI0037840628
MSFHSRKTGRRAGRPRVLALAAGWGLVLGWGLAATLAGATAAHADEFASDWSYGKKSSVRLIAAAQPGGYRAGVEIALDDDAITYWRNPGDAGAPPEFDFSQSDNIDEATVRFPPPERLHEDGLDVFGYRRGVLLPVSLRVRDASRPATLVLALTYAVCGKICIPASAHVQMRLPAGAGARPDARKHEDALKAAEARVPRRLDARERDEKLSLSRDPDAARPSWRVKLREAPGDAADLFVEAPAAWFFETRRGAAPDEFIVTEVEAPREAGHAPSTLTFTSGTQAFEFAADLGRARAVAESESAQRQGEVR